MNHIIREAIAALEYVISEQFGRDNPSCDPGKLKAAIEMLRLLDVERDARARLLTAIADGFARLACHAYVTCTADGGEGCMCDLEALHAELAAARVDTPPISPTLQEPKL